MKPTLVAAAVVLLGACEGSERATAAIPAASAETPAHGAVGASTGLADGDWSCRAGAALVGGLRVAGASYVFDAADGVSSGRGSLSGDAETLTVVSGPLKTELGLLTLVYHMGSEYPSLTGMNELGAAMTCFHAE